MVDPPPTTDVEADTCPHLPPLTIAQIQADDFMTKEVAGASIVVIANR